MSCNWSSYKYVPTSASCCHFEGQHLCHNVSIFPLSNLSRNLWAFMDSSLMKQHETIAMQLLVSIF